MNKFNTHVSTFFIFNSKKPNYSTIVLQNNVRKIIVVFTGNCAATVEDFIPGKT